MAAGYTKRRGVNLPIKQLDPRRYLPLVPENENGVVYVFALVAKELGFEVDSIQAPFPDCLARWKGKRKRIEFAFRSSNFERHGHDPARCDLVVCWEHDWPGMPAGLAPIELRKLFGMARDGLNRWRFLGRPGRKPLRPGRYRVTAVASTSDKTSQRAEFRLQVVG